jgi:hypothetical protein
MVRISKLPAVATFRFAPDVNSPNPVDEFHHVYIKVSCNERLKGKCINSEKSLRLEPEKLVSGILLATPSEPQSAVPMILLLLPVFGEQKPVAPLPNLE